MGKKDLLKEAIADAKAVKETALASAKLALEEAFNPRIQSMLSRKIQQEIEDEEEPIVEPEVPVEEPIEEPIEEPVKEDIDSSEIGTGDNKKPSAKSSDDSTKDIQGTLKPEEPAKETDDFVTEQEIPEEEPIEEPEPEEEDELDLEAIIKELEDEAELEEPEEDEDEPVAGDEVVPGEEPVIEEPPVEEPEVEEDEDLDIDIEDDEEEIPTEPDAEPEVPTENPTPGEDEEELDIESLMKELEADEKVEDELGKVAALESSLREHRKVIRLLKSRLNEINILNAKLLFTNKIFRNFSLSSKEKMKIIENFDLARSVREIKLVYATLCENLNTDKKVPTPVKRITEGASRVVKSTKPVEKILNEGADQVARIQKLAGIKKSK